MVILTTVLGIPNVRLKLCCCLSYEVAIVALCIGFVGVGPFALLETDAISGRFKQMQAGLYRPPGASKKRSIVIDSHHVKFRVRFGVRPESCRLLA